MGMSSIDGSLSFPGMLQLFVCGIMLNELKHNKYIISVGTISAVRLCVVKETPY